MNSLENGKDICVNFNEDCDVEISLGKVLKFLTYFKNKFEEKSKKIYIFDHVFKQTSEQKEIYEISSKSLVKSKVLLILNIYF